jgi:photosystem II stability/assembly factor-like uncharacterized protein
LVSKVFLATTSQGLQRAAYDSGTWTVTAVAPAHDVRCLAADPDRPHLGFAGTRGGVLKSSDGGLTWAESGLSGIDVRALAVSGARPGRLLAGTKPPRVFLSDDGGLSWSELEAFRRIPSRRFWLSPAELPSLTAYVLGLALSATDPDLILAGVELGAVVRSTDGGRAWQDHRPGALRDCHCLIANATAGDWFYEGGGSGGGAAFSRDGGANWERLPGLDRHYGWAAAADPLDPQLQYVSVSPGVRAHGAHADAAIFRSRGGRWARLDGGLPDPLDGMPYALLTGPGAGEVTAGLSNGEVWESQDGGDSWTRLDFRFPGIHRCMPRIAEPKS